MSLEIWNLSQAKQKWSIKFVRIHFPIFQRTQVPFWLRRIYIRNERLLSFFNLIHFQTLSYSVSKETLTTCRKEIEKMGFLFDQKFAIVVVLKSKHLTK